MTRKELRAGHVALWEWLAETGGDDKRAWPGWVFNGGEYEVEFMLCFACSADIDAGCNICPIAWTGGACHHDDAEYMRWVKAKRLATRKRIAAKIATMWPEEK